ncbi:hypothetical protein OS493_005711 [Desmophyllum pertusum]|uniref:Uncharacterized protein n=1 Tax=Desmophyllum pertusum TaxID=174260 RepID=A0A9W9YF81_9CNID|nr:hypothetical protein OS493_005711 [Desmophyllum pertusum]
MEQLTRRVLSFSSKPLVIYVTLVDLIEKVKWWKRILNPRCFNLEDVGQHEIARYYNITVLSWRDVVCPMDENISKRRIEIKPGMLNEDHIHIGMRVTSGNHKMRVKTEGGKGFDVLLNGIVLGPAGMKDIKEYKPTNTLQKAWSLEDYKMLRPDYTYEST